MVDLENIERYKCGNHELTIKNNNTNEFEDWKKSSESLGFKVCKLTELELNLYLDAFAKVKDNNYWKDLHEFVDPVLLKVQSNHACQTKLHDAVILMRVNGNLEAHLLGRPQ